jgi:hypothetical protein
MGVARVNLHYRPWPVELNSAALYNYAADGWSGA